MGKHLRKYPVCTNCEYAFTTEQPDNFCPRCGQENHDLNVPFNHVALELLEGTIHYDSKFWTTVKYLLFYPGKLTNEFHRGRRMGYVPPIRLYVFISFLFFFLLSLRVGHVKSEQENSSIAEQVKAKNAAEFVKKIEVARDSVTADVGQKQLAEALAEIDSSTNVVKQSLTFETTLEKMGSVSDFAPQATIDSLIREDGLSPNWYTQSAMRKTVHLMKLPQEQLITKLLKYWSVLMFVLMPVFALLLKLVFYRARRFYMEHLIFSIHLHCFFFVLYSICMLLLYLSSSFDLFGWATLLGALYLYLGLKRVFRRSKLRTLFNMAAVLLLYFFAGVVTLGLGLVVSAVL